MNNIECIQNLATISFISHFAQYVLYVPNSACTLHCSSMLFIRTCIGLYLPTKNSLILLQATISCNKIVPCMVNIWCDFAIVRLVADIRVTTIFCVTIVVWIFERDTAISYKKLLHNFAIWQCAMQMEGKIA